MSLCMCVCIHIYTCKSSLGCRQPQAKIESIYFDRIDISVMTYGNWKIYPWSHIRIHSQRRTCSVSLYIISSSMDHESIFPISLWSVNSPRFLQYPLLWPKHYSGQCLRASMNSFQQAQEELYVRKFLCLYIESSHWKAFHVNKIYILTICHVCSKHMKWCCFPVLPVDCFDVCNNKAQILTS